MRTVIPRPDFFISTIMPYPLIINNVPNAIDEKYEALLTVKNYVYNADEGMGDEGENSMDVYYNGEFLCHYVYDEYNHTITNENVPLRNKLIMDIVSDILNG